MTHDVLINVIANLIASLILLILAAALIIAGSALNFKRLFRFFGIASRRPSVTIQVSRLEIKPGGAKGADPLIEVGYVGPAINHVEYIGALLIRDLLRSKFLTIFPKGLAAWMGKQLRLRIIDPKIELSPRTYDASSLEAQNIIASDDDVVFVLGSSAYNSLTQFFLQNESYPFLFKRNEAGKLVLMARSGGEVEGRPSKELGVIQRITNRPSGKVIFLCAGIGTSATLGCVKYLVFNWRKIHQSCGTKDFVICLSFTGQSPDSENVTTPEIVPGGFILMR